MNTEGGDLHGAPLPREDLKTEVSVLVVATSPSVRKIVTDQQARVHMVVDTKRCSRVSTKHEVVEARDTDVRVSKGELLRTTQGDS